MIFPIFQKTSLVFHIVPIHVLQCTPVVLEICNVLLVLKKVDTIVTWFYLLMGDDDLMMKSKSFNATKFSYRISCANVKHSNRKHFSVHYKAGQYIPFHPMLTYHAAVPPPWFPVRFCVPPLPVVPQGPSGPASSGGCVPPGGTGHHSGPQEAQDWSESHQGHPTCLAGLEPSIWILQASKYAKIWTFRTWWSLYFSLFSSYPMEINSFFN